MFAKIKVVLLLTLLIVLIALLFPLPALAAGSPPAQEFDPETFVVGGVQLIVLVFGLVEFAKAAFRLQGQAVTVLAAVMGAVVMIAYQLQTLLPAPYAQVYEIFVTSVAFGLSASGYYKFVSARVPPSVG